MKSRLACYASKLHGLLRVPPKSLERLESLKQLEELKRRGQCEGGGSSDWKGSSDWSGLCQFFLSGKRGGVTKIIEGPGKEICYAACVQSDNRGRWTGTTQDYLANGRMLL